jgi:hypothetical protein
MNGYVSGYKISADIFLEYRRFFDPGNGDRNVSDTLDLEHRPSYHWMLKPSSIKNDCPLRWDGGCPETGVFAGVIG